MFYIPQPKKKIEHWFNGLFLILYSIIGLIILTGVISLIVIVVTPAVIHFFKWFIVSNWNNASSFVKL